MTVQQVHSFINNAQSIHYHLALHAVLSHMQKFAFSKVFENRLNHQIVRKLWLFGHENG